MTTPTNSPGGGARPSPPHSERLTLEPSHPFDHERLKDFFAHRAVVGVESATPGGARFARALQLPGGEGVATVEPRADALAVELELSAAADRDLAVNTVRRLYDLDADSAQIDAVLADDPLLRASVERRPGIRVPGAVDGAELALRAVLGQQVSVAAATTAAGRITAEVGQRLQRPRGELTHLFPEPAAVAEVDPASLPMPGARARALVSLAARLADGSLPLDGSLPSAEVHQLLLAQSGIGEWTAQYILMRALHERDAFIDSDLGVRRGLEALGLDGSPRAAAARAERWRPYRAYAAMHLWAIASDKIAP